jgi:vancomycin permeability regulator SanA
VLLPVSWLLCAAGLDACGQRSPPVGPFDAIIVAGCHLMPDGSPSEPLKRRTALAVSLWQSGLAPTLILTGGTGEHPPAEAVAAAAYATSLGVPEAALLVEDRSTSTAENAAFAAELSDARQIIVVTDSYHVFRAERVFGRHFGDATGMGSIAPTDARITGSLREVAALGWYAVRGRL